MAKFLRIENDMMRIDTSLSNLQTRKNAIDDQWQEYYAFIEDNYKRIINFITSPMDDDNDISISKTPRTRGRPAKRATRSMAGNDNMVDKKTPIRSTRKTARKSRRPTQFSTINENSSDESKSKEELDASKENNEAKESSVVSNRIEGVLKTPLAKRKLSKRFSKVLEKEEDKKSEICLPAELKSIRKNTRASTRRAKTSDSSFEADAVVVKELVTKLEVTESKIPLKKRSISKDVDGENEKTVGNVNNEQNETEIIAATSQVENNDNKQEEETKKQQAIPNEMPNEVNDDWMTDEESDEEYEDANDLSIAQTGSKRKLFDSKLMMSNSSRKSKRNKQSMYFTPKNALNMSCKTNTRTQSRIMQPKISQTSHNQSNANLSASKAKCHPSVKKFTPLKDTGIDQPKLVTPSTVTRSQARFMSQNDAQQSGSGYASHKNESKLISRTNGIDSKQLTASAAKRRNEIEERRLKQLEAAKEKEEKANKARQERLQQQIMERKIRSAEKTKKVEMIRIHHQKQEEEKRKKEMERREEVDKRVKQMEEERKQTMKQRAEILNKKAQENEKRKVDIEEKERLEKIQKQELYKNRQENINLKVQNQESIAYMIQQHNTSLQQKALANSFLKKMDSRMNENQVQNNVDASSTHQPTSSVNVNDKQPLNSTFLVPKEDGKGVGKQESDMRMEASYLEHEEHNSNNYDISEIKSDNDDDEERDSRKPIPIWAKGAYFAQAIKLQFAKPLKMRLKESSSLFPVVPLPVELGLIFQGAKSVTARYAKRTSSAIWNSPPIKNQSGNVSMNRSVNQSSFFDM